MKHSKKLLSLLLVLCMVLSLTCTAFAADGAATTGIDFDVIGSPPPSHRTGFRQDGPRRLTIKSIAARSDSLVNKSHFYPNDY